MSQNNNLLDLLAGSDNEDDEAPQENEFAALLRAKTPPVQAQHQGSSGVANGTAQPPNAAAQAYSQAQAQAAARFAQARPSQPALQGVKQEPNSANPQIRSQPVLQQARSGFQFPILLQWCQENLPQPTKDKQLQRLNQIRAQFESGNLNDMATLYSAISETITPQKFNSFSAAYRKLENKDPQQSAIQAQLAQQQLQRQQAAQRLAQQQRMMAARPQTQQPASNPGIMQSLRENAPNGHPAASSQPPAPAASAPQQRPQFTQQQYAQYTQYQQQQQQQRAQQSQQAQHFRPQAQQHFRPQTQQQLAAQQQQQAAQQAAAQQRLAAQQHAARPAGQPRPSQPWVSNGVPYGTNPNPRPAQPQPSQGVRPGSFPAFTPSSGVQAVRAAPGQNLPPLTQAQRPHLVQQPPQGVARPPQQYAALKHPAESAPAGQPAAKKAKKDKDDIDEDNDVLKDSGVNLEEEQNALVGGVGQTGPALAPRPAPQRTEPTFCNMAPLRHQIEEIVRRHGLTALDPQVVPLISLALDAHFSNILGQVFSMARQRTDADRKRPGMVMSNNLRKKLHEINMRDAAAAKEREAQKQAETEDDAQVGTKRKRDDDGQTKKSQKSSKRELSEQQQASDANAALTAFGKTKWNKWGAKSGAGSAAKASVAAAKPTTAGSKPAEKPDRTPEGLPPRTPVSQASNPPAAPAPEPKPVGESALGASRANAEAMTAKLPDLIAVMEKDRMYQKSTLLYKLYSQIRD